MAKSQETFNKKEKEKARLKKRKEKEEKREDRKLQGNKSQSLDDMLAYVDENGNLTSTPPDLSKKREIPQEEIRIRVVKQENSGTPADYSRQGVVGFFNESKGYGFIKDQQDQRSIFVHKRGLLEPVKENDRVTFLIEQTPKGPNAIEVKKVR
ncbi:cold-shock protein [Larkinella bovis]|uniref:Cold-shock protein n=1 Tax=Larkinella bovis TaxID=683041 RepID=A0ABW0IIA0_9BACT